MRGGLERLNSVARSRGRLLLVSCFQATSGWTAYKDNDEIAIHQEDPVAR
jgi:hypothetical protein